jgi:hypothetical protein
MENPAMVLKKIFDRLSPMSIYEKRVFTDGYYELVFLNKEIDEWEQIFTDILGPAAKPPKVDPSDADLSLTREFGGIYVNQTLFKKEYGNKTIIAMFWPWDDPRYITLKIVLVGNDK